jgi:hypothetical protein
MLTAGRRSFIATISEPGIEPREVIGLQVTVGTSV